MYKKNQSYYLLYITILFVFSMTANTAIAATELRYKQHWPRLSQPWYFNGMHKIALDNRELVYIADSGNNRIQVFTKNGSFVRTLGKEGQGNSEFSYPKGLAVSTANWLYVADSANDRIQVFNQDGVFVRSWGKTGSNEQQFSFPSGVAVADNGTVYVADTKNNRIQAFTSDGEFINTWGSAGSGDGQFNNPNDIIVSSDNQVYVADTNNHRIAVFSASGAFIKNVSKLGVADDDMGVPTGLSYVKSDDSIYVANQGGCYVATLEPCWNKPAGSVEIHTSAKIQIFSTQGVLKKVFKSEDGHTFNGLTGVAAANDGSVYVTEQWSDRVQVFNDQADATQVWQAFNQGDGHFNNPEGVAIDSNGKVYVADRDNARIQVFDDAGKFLTSWTGNVLGPAALAIRNGEVFVTDGYAYKDESSGVDTDNIFVFDLDGNLLRSWGKNGSSSGQFERASGIAISESGLVYITDSKNHRIQVFSKDGTFINSWGSYGQDEGQFTNPVGISISPAGDVYVTETALTDNPFLPYLENHRVQVFTAEGEFIRILAQQGSAEGELLFPSDVVFYDDLVYVSDSGNNRVQVFSATGELKFIVGEVGVGEGQFVKPMGIAVNENNLYVVDAANHRLHQFSQGTGDYGVDTQQQALSHPFKAIVLAGGGPSNGNYVNHIWDATQMLANRAYSTLRSQGFQKNEISFLSPVTAMDLDNNGKFDDITNATLANLEKAILDAKDAQDVFLYLIDHGGPGKFQVNPSEILTAEQLQGWLNQLQSIMPGRISVVIESCKSASFIPALTAKSRIIVGSSKADQAAVISNKGFNAFSYFFWNEVRAGAVFKDAFKAGRQAMSSQLVNGEPQNAQLDSNADGLFDSADFTELGDYCLGNCIQFAASLPVISNETENTTLNGESSMLLSLQVTSLEPILSAWAVVLRPDYYHPDSDEPLGDLPIVELSCNNSGLCTGIYDKFNVTGDYQISYYAQDGLYQMALPVSTQVTQMRSEHAVYDENFGVLTLNDVQVGNAHYRVELLDIGNFNFSIKGEIKTLTEAASTQPVEYDFNTMQLSIPKVEAFGQLFRVEMQHSGDFVFTIQGAGLVD